MIHYLGTAALTPNLQEVYFGNKKINMTEANITSIIKTTEMVPNIIWPLVASMIIDYFGFLYGIYLAFPLKILATIACFISVTSRQFIFFIASRILLMSGTWTLLILNFAEILK
jgi:hypothetical protein